MFKPRMRGRAALVAAAASCLWLAPGATIAEEQVIEEVVVTGSYIRRTTADSPSPLSVIDRAQIENIGATEVADIVNRMTYNAGSTNVTNAFSGDDNSTGETNINLRNLGLGSTLVLLNGRRSVPANNDSGGNAYVSTSILMPTIALERVEVVKDGASALYGSDAVAGVVNFITRDDFEGAEFQAKFASDQESWEQDDLTLSGIWGANSDRGSIVVSAEYLDREGLQIDDRYDDYGLSGVSTLGNPGTFVPEDDAVLGAYLVGGGAATGLGPTVPVAGDIDCELADSLHRQSFRAPSFGTPFAGALESLGACIYDFAPMFNIVGEEDRLLSLVNARYELTDTLETYAEFGFSDQEFRRGNSLFPLVRFPTIPADNPGLVNDFARRSEALTGDPSAIPPVPTTFFGRVLGFTPDEGPDSRVRPVDTDTTEFIEQHRTVVGLRGDLPFGNNWTFDAAFTYSEHDESTRNTDTKQQNLLLALQGLGGPNCDLTGLALDPGDPDAATPGEGGCEYWNPFFSGYFQPDGSPQTDPELANSPELLNWMVGEIMTDVEETLTVVDAVFTGDLVDMPAGPLGLAFGVQFRRNEIDVNVDSDSNANNYSFIFGAADYQAREDVLAGFVELGIPVTDRLDVQLAGRVEDFEENDETTFDPKITGMFRATDALTLRASAGTSFRVGSLLQRFGQSTQLINIADPFSGSGLAFRPQIGFGNPDVSPEEATTWNVGLSWAPEEGALQGFSVDLDYYDYDYDDLITLEGPADLVARDAALRCPQGLDDDPTNDVPDCGLQDDGSIISLGEGIPDQVVRNPGDLQLLRVEPTYSNAQELEVSGLDFTIGYDWELGDLGLLNTSLTGSWAREWDLTRADGVTIDGVGSRNFGTTIGRSLPEWKVNLGLNWLMDRHSAFVLVRYIDAYEDNQSVENPNDDAYCLGSCLRAFATGMQGNIAESEEALDRRINSFTTVDVQYTYELPEMGIQEEGSSISIGGYNVFNRTPPRVNVDGLFDPFTHDPRGAIWYLRYSMNL
ncbi:MAG: TonB-dependent receptor domain-containing protein [Pseudomonadota bacterium]